MSDITTKLQLKLEENLERNAALKKENRELRADLRQLQGMSNAQADFTNDDAEEIEALKSDIARHVEISSDQANEIASLRSRLSVYEEGIRAEDADESKLYIYWFGDIPCVAYWDDFLGSAWSYNSGDGTSVLPDDARLYPIAKKEKR